MCGETGLGASQGPKETELMKADERQVCMTA